MFSRVWHEYESFSLDAARTRRAWSEGRERERTPQRPGGEAVPPKFPAVLEGRSYASDRFVGESKSEN